MSNTTKRFLMSAAGAGGAKTYIEDLFSTYIYRGTGAARSITSGVDLSTDGGLVITKNRDTTNDWMWGSTPPSLGTGRYIPSNVINQRQNDAQSYTAFNNNGYSIGTSAGINGNGNDLVGYSFRKIPGFLDIVEFVGNGASSRDISHNLGSVPGWIVIMCTTKSENKTSWHRGLELNDSMYIDSSNGASNIGAYPQLPTSTQFTTGSYNNLSGETYVAWIFAGGESTADTARSVEFDGSNDYLSIPDNDAWDISSSDVTVECWAKFDSHNGHDGIIHNLHSTGLPGNGTSGWALEPVGETLCVYWGTTVGGYGNVNGAQIPLGQWQHMVFTKSGSTITIYQDGVKTGSGSISGTINPGVVPLQIGGNCVGEYCDCKISNVRITKGQALYTSDFTPSTEPLTTTSQGATASNVKLLCCNDSSATGSTVTPDTITNNNGSTASIDSPFDDPAGFVFGDNEDQSIISAGSYIGNGSTNGPEINLGWEPSFIILKCSSHGGESWQIYDSMRGLADTSEGSKFLKPNSSDVEASGTIIKLTSTGFQLTDSSGSRNNNGRNYIYIAIRRSDGYVGKPAKVGTDVFTVVNGDTDGDATTPWMLTPFIVDFALFKGRTITHNWGTSPRLTQGWYLSVNQTRAETSNIHQRFDFMNGFNDGTDTSGNYTGWLWKRYAGFDVVIDKGNGQTTKTIAHGLGIVPEMIWRKNRDGGNDNWQVYHIGLNGGTNPHLWRIYLNTTNGNTNDQWTWDSAPTATHFTVGSNGAVNRNNEDFVTYLFASVDGISKVGYYTGNGSTQTITTGFSPRFVIIRRTEGSEDHWVVLDTTRGWGAGNDKRLKLNSDDPQSDADMGAPTSTGFTLTSNGWVNFNTGNFIYYAHA